MPKPEWVNHAHNLDVLSSIFRNMTKYTKVASTELDLPFVAAADNFMKFMAHDMANSCQYAANRLRELEDAKTNQ